MSGNVRPCSGTWSYTEKHRQKVIFIVEYSSAQYDGTRTLKLCLKCAREVLERHKLLEMLCVALPLRIDSGSANNDWCVVVFQCC